MGIDHHPRTIVTALHPAIVDANVAVSKIGERGRHAINKSAAVDQAVYGMHNVVVGHGAIELIPGPPAARWSTGTPVIGSESRSDEEGQQRPHYSQGGMEWWGTSWFDHK